jgi:hypothetical protein
MGGILIGFLQTILYCAIIIFIAFCIVWAWTTFIGPIDANIYKWGRIIVGLLCLIAIVAWLLSLLGLAGGAPVAAPFHWRW